MIPPGITETRSRRLLAHVEKRAAGDGSFDDSRGLRSASDNWLDVRMPASKIR
jgi:hypothetical protein